MTFAIVGQAVSRGVAIGRAVVVASGRLDVDHYFIDPEKTTSELARLSCAKDDVVQEIERVKTQVSTLSAHEVPAELTALLDVHLMLLSDESIVEGVKQWVVDRRYNAEWALVAQLDVLSRQFEEMQDPYLRERKADLAQVVERMLAALRGHEGSLLQRSPRTSNQPGMLEDSPEVPLVLIAHDLSPADLLQFKQSVFSGFVTDVGGKTSHTAIVARSMDIPAVVGARASSSTIRQDDWVIIDGEAGVVVVNPTQAVREEYLLKQQSLAKARGRLRKLRDTPAITLDGQRVLLEANIELPQDAEHAVAAGAVGVGLFRSEFLFMGRVSQGLTPLPNEEEQVQAYTQAIERMEGMPVTIRTVDIGADKPLDRGMRSGDEHLNPALGLRAIRWSLAEPNMFLAQLRAILRAAAHGKVNLLIPMLSHPQEIHKTLQMVQLAREQLDQQGMVFGPIQLGAMIEVPAAALMVPYFLRYFDFLSIGTNDLIQYTLAVDRVDESVSHLYDSAHPVVLRLIAQIIQQAQQADKGVSVCGEMAGDVAWTRLLLGMGLRRFSMHPSQILTIKEQILTSNTQELAEWAQVVLESDDPAQLLQQAAQVS